MSKTDRATENRARLAQRHDALANEVESIDARRALSPDEELALKQLKKEKLAAKDELETLRKPR